ncbi:hypothetical protein B1A_20998, partial [mine drainage metagenome]
VGIELISSPSSIEALGANNGAIFTTTGFEEGAIAYARGKGIELFVVRDLTPKEWGQPGRHISLHLHVNAAEFRNIQFAGKRLRWSTLHQANRSLGLSSAQTKLSIQILIYFQ